MSKIIDSAGKGSAITAVEHDANLSSMSGINQPQTGTTYTVDVDDQNEVLEFTNAASIAVTLPAITAVSGSNIHTDDFKVTFKNIGAGVVTITRGSTDTFDEGSTSIALAQYEYATIQTDNSLTKWNIINHDIDNVTKTGTQTLTNTTVDNGAFTGTQTGFAGDVTGDLTGNVTGNTSGSSGSCTGNSATATVASTITSQGALATANSVNAGTIDANSVGISELKSTALTYGTTTLGGTASYTVPEGLYTFTVDKADVYIEIYTGSAWVGLTTVFFSGGAVFSDGTNVRLTRSGGVGTANLYYRKLP